MPVTKSIWQRPKPNRDIAGVYEDNDIAPGVNLPAVAPGSGIMQGGGLTVTTERPTPVAAAQAATPRQPAPVRPAKIEPVPEAESPFSPTVGSTTPIRAQILVKNMQEMLRFMDELTKSQGAAQTAQGGVMPGQIPQVVGQPNSPNIPGQVTNFDSGVTQGQAGGIMPGQTPQMPSGNQMTTVMGGQQPYDQSQDMAGYQTPVTPNQPLPATQAPPGAVPLTPLQGGANPQVVPLTRDAHRDLVERASNFRTNPDELLNLTNQVIEKYGAEVMEQLDSENPVRKFYNFYADNKVEGQTDIELAERYTNRQSAKGRKADADAKAMASEAKSINTATGIAKGKAKTAATAKLKKKADEFEDKFTAVLADPKLAGKETEGPNKGQRKRDVALSRLIAISQTKYPDMPLSKQAVEAKAILAGGKSYVAAQAIKNLTATQKTTWAKGATNIVLGIKKDKSKLSPEEVAAMAGNNQTFYSRKPAVDHITYQDYTAEFPNADEAEFQAETYKKLEPGHAKFAEQIERNIKNQYAGDRNADIREAMLDAKGDIVSELWSKALNAVSSDLSAAWDAGGDKTQSPQAGPTGTTRQPTLPNTGPVPAQPDAASTPPSIADEAAYNKLQPGTIYIDARDGKPKRKT